MKNSADHLEKTLAYVIGRASRLLANRLNHNLERQGYDVTCEQFSVLNTLVKKDGQTLKDLAGCACKDKTSITRLIDGMWKRKLVTRVHDKKDARKKMIYLTPRGRLLHKKLVRQIVLTIEEAQKGVSRKEIAVCKKVLENILENLT